MSNDPTEAPTSSISEDLLEVPESFIERFLWNPYPPVAVTSPGDPLGAPIAPNESLSPYQFSSEIVTEVQAALSFHLWSRSQPASATLLESGLINIPGSFILYCPHPGAHDVIDSLVKMVAAREHADVLVLDALELAAGESGALGKSAKIIDSIYAVQASQTASNEPQPPNVDDKSVHRFFDNLVNIGTKSIDKGTGPDPNDSKPRRRIIYLRDYGSIARAAKPLMIYLHQAIVSCSSEGNARVLIMGVTGDKGSAEAPNKAALSRAIPSLDHCYPVLKDGASSAPLNALGAQLFLPLTSESSKIKYEKLTIDSMHGKMVDNFVSKEFVFVALPEDTDSQDFQKQQHRVTCERRRDINDVLLRMHLKGRGAVLSKIPSHEILEETSDKDSPDPFLSSILSWSTATSIAITAMGLACMEIPCATVPMPVSPGNVAKAYRLCLRHGNGREGQVNKNEAQDDEPPDGEDPIVKSVKESKDLTVVEKKHLRCIVDSCLLRTRFDDICVDSSIIETLRTTISLPLLHPAYFKSGLLAKERLTGVLLYGPPGTGKTMLCRALESECDARMLFVKPSDVLEKFVGEDQKNIVGLFKLANRLAPCILFIDEMDALFSARQESTKDWRKDMLTEFMQAMDGLISASENSDKGIILVGATNRPFDLDEAILRRLPCRMLVDLPTEPERLKILKVYLREENVHGKLDLIQLAHETEDYSGSDLKNLCVSAAQISALETVKSEFGKIDWTSSRQKLAARPIPKASEGLTKAEPPRVIRRAHFDQALSRVFPSFSEKASSQLYSWHKTFSLGIGSRYVTPSSKKTIGKKGSKGTYAHTKGSRNEDEEFDRFMSEIR